MSDDCKKWECSHCHSMFTPTYKQRWRMERGELSNPSCSKLCAEERKKAKHIAACSGRCPVCGSDFISKYAGKRFCSLKCYTSTDEFKNRARLNCDKGRATRIYNLTGEAPRQSVTFNCLSCGREKTVRASLGHQKFCNKRCYRAYMADRFDRWVASPHAIALPQNYDEFLSMEELPCLVDGCGWVGKNLGQHVNFTHGIPAREFKQIAGFNIGSGLCSPATSESIAARPHLHADPFGGLAGNRGQVITKSVHGAVSIEAREHMFKARSMKIASDGLRADKECRHCGSHYTPRQMDTSSRFCSPKCRTDAARIRSMETKFSLTCGLCSSAFMGSIGQKKSADAGNAVYCSPHCRQVANGRMSAIKRGQAVHSAQFTQKENGPDEESAKC